MNLKATNEPKNKLFVNTNIMQEFYNEYNVHEFYGQFQGKEASRLIELDLKATIRTIQKINFLCVRILSKHCTNRMVGFLKHTHIKYNIAYKSIVYIIV